MTIYLLLYCRASTSQMNFPQQSQVFRNGKKQLQSRKYYEKLLYQHFTTEFIYRRGVKYICLTQEKLQGDLFYTDFGQTSQQNKVIKSYLLDPDLSIIWEGTYVKFLDEELAEKQSSLQSDYSYKCKINSINCYRLCFQKRIFQQPQCYLPSIEYIKYPTLHNFKIGRSNFVRAIQGHKISSDLISKQHCQLIHFKSNGIQILNYFKTIKKILLNYTSLKSNIRKIPSDIWHNIFQYIKPKSKYMLTDLGSRNGTWVSQEGTQIYQLQQNFDYQFDKQSYSIHIIKIFTSQITENQTIIKHNKKAHQLIQQFKKQVNWNYYQRANKIMLLQDAQNIPLKQDQKIQVLIFKVKYRDYHQFYLLASNKGCNKKYSVGCKYDIDINPEEYDTPSLHGQIYVENGKWKIQSFQLKRNGQYRKIWTKIVKDYPYSMNYLKNYKIRLGCSFFFNLQFHNF